MKREKLVILNLYMFYAIILQCYGQWPLVEKFPKLFKNYKKIKERKKDYGKRKGKQRTADRQKKVFPKREC